MYNFLITKKSVYVLQFILNEPYKQFVLHLKYENLTNLITKHHYNTTNILHCYKNFEFVWILFVKQLQYII